MEKAISRRNFIKGLAATGIGFAAGSILGGTVAVAEKAQYIPGTYSAKAAGMGDVIVTMTFDENNITDVVLDLSNETADIGQLAKEELTQAIMDAQGSAFDAVSGATVTSTAVRKAAEKCIQQAKGEIPIEVITDSSEETGKNDDWLGTEPAISDSDVDEEYTADVVVIGTGIAGVAATRSAVEEGASVIVVEKTEEFFGRGGTYTSVNGPLNKQLEMPEYDIDEVVDELMRASSFRVKRPIIKRWAEESGETVNWFVHAKEDIYLAEKSFADIPDEHKDLFVKPFHWPIHENWDPSDQIYPIYTAAFQVGPGAANDRMCRKNLEYAEEHGDVDIHYSTFAKKLILDDTGRVTGVYAECNGKIVKFNATKGLVLATGDYANNETMLKAFAPECIENGNDPKSIWSTNDALGQKTNIGDGHRMATWIGAQMQQNHAPMLHNMGGVLGVAPFIFLNSDGVRFMNENIPGQQLENQIDLCLGKYAYQIFDDNWREEIPLMPCSHGIPGKYYADGEATPVNNSIFNGKTAITESGFQKSIESGVTITADTLEELLDKLEINKEQALASIQHYNEMCDEGKDSDFAKVAKYMFKCEKGPFYAAKITPTVLLVVCGGLSSDENCHIFNQDNNVIPGIYVAGNVQGDRFAIEYPIEFPGLSLSMAMVYGRIAGYNAVHGI